MAHLAGVGALAMSLLALLKSSLLAGVWIAGLWLSSIVLVLTAAAALHLVEDPTRANEKPPAG